MKNISNVLVVLDPTTSEQKAFDRSIQIAKATGARLTLFLCVYDFSYEMTTMLSTHERDTMKKAVLTDRQVWIEELTSNAQLDNINYDIDVVWHNRPFEAIIQKVTEGQYDLAVKGTHPHSVLKSVIFTPTDWHLLRKSPSPVLLVKDHQWSKNGQVIAAVNAGSDQEEHIALNDKIVHDAGFIADKLESNLNIINAYPATPANIAIEIPEFDHTAYSDSVRKHHESATDVLAEKFDVNAKHVYVRPGLPEDVIPRVAEELDAELVVIGSIGRTGISAALLGNTAENVIDQLNCDILALRP